MAKKKKNTLSNEEIGSLIQGKIDQSTGYLGGSQLSKEREEILKFLSGEYPKRQGKGSSSYVSTDVWDAVEGMKAQILETFGGSQETVFFKPEGADDVQQAQEASEYCNWNFYRLNDGYTIIHDVAQDGLIARIGIVKVFWETDESYQAETFEGLDEDTVLGLTSQEDVSELDSDQGEDGLYSGSLKRLKTSGRVTVIPIAPEEFFIDNTARDLTAFHGHRCLKTKTQLKAMGYDVKLLEDIAPDGDDLDLMSQENAERFKKIDNGGLTRDQAIQDENKPYWFYECYARLVLEEGGDEALYKVCMAGGEVLAVDEINRSPFKVFTPLRTSHSFFGENYAQKSVSTANARTALMRGILDHTSITTNPRYQVLAGGLINPRELLDNRLGGIVNVTRPDAVNPIMPHPLNPFVFQTLELLKVNNEERIGISSLSQGLNKDAISNQNSQGMVSDLVALSQVRQKVIARNMGRFLADVMLEIHDLALENEDGQTIMEVAGTFTPVNPKTWRKRKDASISFHLGTGAAQQEAMKYAMLTSMATQDPALARMITEENKYNIATKVMKLQGITDIQNYITHPSKLPPPQPDPMMQAQLKKVEAEAQSKMATAQAAGAKVQATAMQGQVNAQIAQRKQDLEERIKLADNHRKDVDIANKVDISQREMQVVESTPPEAMTAMASPNS